MPTSNSVTESIVRRGREIYERDLRDRLEADHRGRFAAIDSQTGDYEVGDDELTATRLLRDRRPGVQPYIVRIGASAAYRLGGHFQTGIAR